MMKKTSSKPMPTPATAAAPRRATMKVSTAPTSVCSRFSPMIGVASASTRRCVIGSITTGSGIGIGRAVCGLMPVSVAGLAGLSHDLQLGQWLG